MKEQLALTLVLSAFILATVAGKDKIVPAYEWSQLEFDYPSERDRQEAINNGEFAVGKPAPIDVDVHYSWSGRRKVFVTIPRFQPGVPATVGVVTKKTYNGNPVIAPFPSWEWHRNPAECRQNRIVSVFRVKVDECDRLWVLDLGILLSDMVCPPQILAFDVNSGALLHKYEIPKDQVLPNTFLATPIVDVRDGLHKCRNTFVYAADVDTYALIVHDVAKRTSWRITDKSMHPDPRFQNYTIAGDEFQLMDGILGMDLSPYKRGKDRILYYHAMSSGKESWVYTSHIRNQSLFTEASNTSLQIFNTYAGERSSQVPPEAIDKNGIAYFGLASHTSINCWNTATEYDQENIHFLAVNQTTLQFPSGIKVISKSSRHEELWVLTNRFQKIATGTIDPTETNYRILTARIEDLIRGSKCVLHK